MHDDPRQKRNEVDACERDALAFEHRLNRHRRVRAGQSVEADVHARADPSGLVGQPRSVWLDRFSMQASRGVLRFELF